MNQVCKCKYIFKIYRIIILKKKLIKLKKLKKLKHCLVTDLK
jgi:hypothetical protein